jgi:hypothetical protein
MWRSSIRRRRTMTIERMTVVTVPESAENSLD